MSQQLKGQANQWWQAVTDQKTFNTYQETIQTTWKILQETVKLSWLILCLALVLAGWLWRGSFSSGQQLKTWIDALEEPKANAVWIDVKDYVLGKTQILTTQLLNQARGQLGLSPIAIKAPAPKAIAQSKADHA
jgi:hypothetical protein